MEDTWLYVEDDDNYQNASDSDIIDSETEAELYSSIHYEENLNALEVKNVNIFVPEPFVTTQNGSSGLLSETGNTSCSEDKKIILNVCSSNASKSVSNDHDCTVEEKMSGRNSFSKKISKQDLSPAKKLKLDSGQKERSANLCSNDSKEMELNESSKHKSLNHIQSNHNTHIKQSPQKNKSSTVDSSDSDSIIWTETDSQKKSDFKTNLLDSANTICLSSSDSDSESEKPVLSSATERQFILKNLSMPNIKIGHEASQGLWQINDEDLYRQRKYSRRYHDTVDLTCSNCQEKGHTIRTCTVPKAVICFICGGSHSSSRCRNRICGNCYNYGHERKRCQIRPNNLFCSLCSLRGHTKENCPDLWRRYHLTTDSVRLVPGRLIKQDTNMYCFNCGDSGHFGAVCHERYSKSLFTWPAVVSYDDPDKLLRNRLNTGSESTHGHFTQNTRIQNVNIYAPANINTPANISRKRREKHLKQRNDLDTTDDLIESKKEKKRRRKAIRFKKRMQMQMNIVGERDFPRTPKKGSPKKPFSEIPESFEMFRAQQLKNRKRNRRRKLSRQQKKAAVNQ